MRFRFSTHLKTTWLFDTTAFYQRILNKPHLDFPVNLKRSNLKLSMTEIESNDKTTNFPSGKNTTTPFCIINDLTQSSFGPFVQSNKNTCFGFTETLILQFLSHFPFALFYFILFYFERFWFCGKFCEVEQVGDLAWSACNMKKEN